jgi:hypothetical protein
LRFASDAHWVIRRDHVFSLGTFLVTSLFLESPRVTATAKPDAWQEAGTSRVATPLRMMNTLEESGHKLRRGSVAGSGDSGVLCRVPGRWLLLSARWAVNRACTVRPACSKS